MFGQITIGGILAYYLRASGYLSIPIIGVLSVIYYRLRPTRGRLLFCAGSITKLLYVVLVHGILPTHRVPMGVSNLIRAFEYIGPIVQSVGFLVMVVEERKVKQQQNASNKAL